MGNGLSDVIAEQIIRINGIKKVVVAPTDAGNFVNYEKDKKIEEKCFPHLFPKGEGGYISTYALKGVSFSNYIKMRLYGIDRRYSSDTLYIVFLYQVKEALKIKRSKVTFFRNSKVKYTRDTILSLQKTELERSSINT